MEYQSNEIRAGCLVIVGIVLLVIFLILISGLDFLASKKSYYAQFKYTSGVEVGSLVRYGGMEVGRVKKVGIAPDDNTMIRFEIEIDGDVPVKKDSEVFITSIGIMGDEYIEISTGSPNADLMPPGSLLNCKDVTPLMMLTDSFDQLSQKLSLTIDNLNQILGQNNQSQIQQVLVNLNRLLEDNQQAIAGLMANSNDVISHLSQLSGRLDTMLLENQDHISHSIQQLEATLIHSQELIQNMQQTMKNVNQMITAQNGNYSEIIDNLNRTSRNLDEFTRTLKERPWSLIRKSAPKERGE
ncbi:MAG: MCE family protein [candidate division KSB1 bacterium]|nr:MCE family protein [candidate division KSB1 bacterium]MDZ7317970.1 MCE family protein [candidate division KSB1 bacterium]MDZ7341065.1 MCE family protein [candidate division KSB1 bacterium]